MGDWVLGPRSITALVLAGGRSTRWGGRDKGLIPVDGVPMALSVLQRLQTQAHAALAGVAINANRHTPDYAAWGWPVWPDPAPTAFHGPLAGWQSGLRRCPTPWLLSVPCDSPDFASALIDRLVQAQGEKDSPLALAASRCASGLRPEPVFALIHTRLLPSLEGFLAAGGRGVLAWCALHQPAWAIFDGDGVNDPFANLNSPADARRHWRGRPRA